MQIEKDFKNKLTKKDYITYLFTKNMVLLLSPVIIIALVTAIVVSLVRDGWNYSLLIYALPIILFILSYFRIYRLINHTIKSQKQLYELKITLTENEYRDLTNGEKNSLAYDRFYCYKETKKYFYLFVDKYNALILPKREFSDDEVIQVNNFLSNKIRKTSVFDVYSILMILIVISLVGVVTYRLFVK